jgi:hypothetical protein
MQRVRPLQTVCKLSGTRTAARGHTLLAALFTLAPLSACTLSTPVRVVTLDSLEAAPAEPIIGAERHLVGNAAALRPLCTALGPRLGLVQIRSRQDWRMLYELAPTLGPCPDLRAGTLVGIACWAGTPVDGEWPVELESIRVQAGGGLLKVHFCGGTYWPDGTACLVTDYVRGLASVLVVDVDGTSFYPDNSSEPRPAALLAPLPDIEAKPSI